MEGRWIGHVVDLPGCFASDPERHTCLKALPGAMGEYHAWQRAHGAEVAGGAYELELDEVVRGWELEAGYEVNAFFASDRPALSAAEIEQVLGMLEWSRADLLAAVDGLSDAVLDSAVENDWSMRRILGHIGRAEWWYLDRLGLAFPQEDVPEEVFERLSLVRSQARAALPTLASDRRVVEAGLELWSPRKLLRRMLWHERDHTAHSLAFRQRIIKHGGVPG